MRDSVGVVIIGVVIILILGGFFSLWLSSSEREKTTTHKDIYIVHQDGITCAAIVGRSGQTCWRD